jgi:Domain of unknown function (DUF4328)
VGVRPIRGLATAISVLLGVQVVVTAVQAATLIHRVDLIHRIQRGASVTQAQADAADASVTGVAGFEAMVFIATVIVWCVWQHRAQGNAQRFVLGTTTFTPGWAVGWWFVPIANLFKPFQAVSELWKASHGGPAWRELSTWSLIGWWWGVWLASIINVWIGGRAIGVGVRFGSDTHVSTVDQLAARDTWSVGWLVFRAVAAVLAIVIVRSVGELQQRAAAFPPPTPPTPPTTMPYPPPPPVP